ncbi:MAG: kelch repeat-containing protein [Phycisphaerales bacterium]
MMTTLIAGAIVLGGQWAGTHAWTEDSGPEPREHAAVLSLGDELIVFAGSGYAPQMSPLQDAWRYDTGTHEWTELTIEGDLPSEGGSIRPVRIAEHEWLLFGGYDGSFVCANTLTRATIEGDTLTLKTVEQRKPPPGRALHAIGYDPQSARLVVFGGVSREGMRPGTWVAQEAEGVYTWDRLETETAPSPRFGMSYGFDEASGRLIIASGQDSATAMQMSDEIWALDMRAQPPAWSKIGSVPETNAVRNPCFAWDEPRSSLWVWCGTADGRSNAPDLIEIAIGEDQAEVTRHEHEDDPQRRSSGQGTVMPDGRVWFGFGNHAGGAMRDWVVWEPGADE